MRPVCRLPRPTVLQIQQHGLGTLTLHSGEGAVGKDLSCWELVVLVLAIETAVVFKKGHCYLHIHVSTAALSTSFLCSSTFSYLLKNKKPRIINKIPTHVIALIKGFLFP